MWKYSGSWWQLGQSIINNYWGIREVFLFSYLSCGQLLGSKKEKSVLLCNVKKNDAEAHNEQTATIKAGLVELLFAVGLF